MKKVFTFLSMLLAIAASSWAAPGDVVTDLSQLSETKTYVIENLRGRLAANANGSIYNLAFANDDGVSNDQADNDNDEQRFFILPADDGIYVYSIAAQKFFVPFKSENGATLSEVPVILSVADEFLNPTENRDGDATEQYRWFLSAYDKWLNLGGGTWKFDGWGKPDPGNRLRFVETAGKDGDPNPSELIGTTRPILFHLSYDGIERMTAVGEGVIGGAVPVPTEFQNPLLAMSSLKYGTEEWAWQDDNGKNIVPTMRQERNDTLEVYYEAVWGAPFELSTSFADAKWYNMDIRRSAAPKVGDEVTPMYISYSTTTVPYLCQPVDDATQLMMPAYKWAIMGNPFDGVMLINQAAGEGKYLQLNDNNVPELLSGEYLWEVTGVVEGAWPTAISINKPGTTIWANQTGGAAGSFGIWDNGGARRDPGSLLRFTEAPVSDKELTKVTLNAIYNGQTIKTVQADAFVGNTLSTVVFPQEFDNGLVNFDYDFDALVEKDMTLDIPVTFKLDIALDKSKWYNIDLRDGAYYVNAVPTGDQAHYYPIDAINVTADDLNTAPYQWAFEGNPYEVKIYNRAYGDKTLARYLDPNNGGKAVASMRDTVYVWNLFASEEGATLGMAFEASNNKGQYLNQEGGAGDNHLLGFWNNRNESGCRFNAVEVAQVAAPLSPVEVTYHLNYNGEDVRQVTATAFAGDFTQLPASFNNPLLSIDFDAKDASGNAVDQIPAGAETFDVYYSAEWAGVFELSESFADAKWYNMDIRRSEAESRGGYIFVSYGGTAPYSCAAVVTAEEDEYGFINYIEDTNKRAMTNYQWAMIGDPFKGVQLINRAAGEGKTLGVNEAGVPEFAEGTYIWNIIGVDKNDGLDVGFALKTPDANNWINHSLGNNTLVLWVGGSGTDDGSILRFSEVPASEKKQAEITFNAVYNGETVKTGKFFAFEGDILGEAVTLPADWDNGLVSIDYDEMQAVTDGMTVNANVTLKYDIVLDGSKWYNLEIRDSYWVNTERVNGDGHYMPEEKPNVTDEALATNPAYLWTFVGTPYQISILNAAFPSSQSLTNVPVNDHAWAVMQEGQYKWNAYGFTSEEDGTYAFGIEYSDMPGSYINQEGGSGNNRPLGNWNVKFDGGAKLRAFEQPDAKFDGMDDFFTGIETAHASKQSKTEGIYSLNGVRQQTLSKGLNIVRLADGRTVKVMVK